MALTGHSDAKKQYLLQLGVSFKASVCRRDSYGRITIYRSSGTRNINVSNVRWSTNRAGDQVKVENMSSLMSGIMIET